MKLLQSLLLATTLVGLSSCASHSAKKSCCKGDKTAKSCTMKDKSCCKDGKSCEMKKKKEEA